MFASPHNVVGRVAIETLISQVQRSERVVKVPKACGGRESNGDDVSQSST